MTRLTDTIGDKFFGKKIVVVGDLVADQFLHGTIARVSREAPVFILRHDETETLAGGAANAAFNVASLGGKAILVGLVGDDFNGAALLEKLRGAGVDCDFVIASDKYRTTTKVRVLAGQHYAPRQQVIRIDYENDKPLGDEARNKLRVNFFSAVRNADAIIVSDYNYGVANALLVEITEKINEHKSVPALIDSRHNLKNFKGATTATPNQEEVEQILGKDFTEADCVELCENLGFESLLVTRGNEGMLLIEKNRTPLRLEAVGAKHGDCRLRARSGVWFEFFRRGDDCQSRGRHRRDEERNGGSQFRRIDCVAGENRNSETKSERKPENFMNATNPTNSTAFFAPILDRLRLTARVAIERQRRRKIVLANGCFDFFHVGHIRYLAGAKALGDCLIVGVNADEQVRRLKGANRPFMPERERAEIVSAFKFVDFVTIFTEPTVEELIRAIRPDFTTESVPEREIVLRHGGQIAIVGDPKNHSSTDLIEKFGER